jgi:hypothetical protein
MRQKIVETMRNMDLHAKREYANLKLWVSFRLIRDAEKNGSDSTA